MLPCVCRAKSGECQEESGQRGKYITLEDGTKVQDRRHGAVR